MPLFLLSFIGMSLSRRADAGVSEALRWWTIGLVMWAVNATITSVYHLPVNIQLYSVPFTPEEAEAVRSMWLTLHVPRVLLSIGTHLAAVQAALVSARAHGARAAAP